MGSVKKVVLCECRRLEPGETCDECQRRECFEWNWDKDGTGSTVVFHNNDRDVIFNPGFSVGTVAVRGTRPFKCGYHHYWEIEMSTEVYGTDMMIGVGTEKTNLRKYSHNFVSLLGLDEHSWGLSYSGQKRHSGQFQQYSKPFGQNSVIGVHLDLWTGTLEFYVDRKPLGVAFSGLQDKVLYPIISSTAARSGMNLIFCRSYPSSLQLQSMLALSKYSLFPSENTSLFNVLTIPPGLKFWMKNNYWWIVSCRDRERKREEELNNRAKQAGSHQGTRQAEQKHGEDETDSGDDDTNYESHLNPSNAATNALRESDDEAPSTQEEQCTQSSSNDSTNCMRMLAATASTRAHFLGRISPIFIGLPEGGFSVLSSIADPGSSSVSRPVARSRSVPAQASSSTGGIPGMSKLVRESVLATSSSEDEDDNDGTPRSARKEPKRLRLRVSIEVDAVGEDINAKPKPGNSDGSS